MKTKHNKNTNKLHTMKNKIALASAALIAASSVSQAEIVINDFLSFEGFVDMSYTHTDGKFKNIGRASDNSFAVDQVEITWLFDFDPVTAQIDLTYLNGDETGETTMGYDDFIEQAFVSYHIDDGSTINAGRFYSMLGFEAFKAPGLYQYSTAYQNAALDFFDVPGFLPDGGQGVQYTYNDDTVFFGVSLLDSTYNINQSRLGGSGTSSYAFEVAGAVMLSDELTFFLGGAYEDADNFLYDDLYTLNTYVTYETGAWVFAGELNYFRADIDAGGKDKGWSGLLMANFAYSEEASVTGRYSYQRYDFDSAGLGNAKPGFHKWTLAHTYAFTDNLALITEYSHVRGNSDADKYREHLFAAELLFTF
ncbi:MAG: hypothetical protein EA353_02210 [Puniceicoccaceae bacterium]|nr:MAG: hypothetical protein EA353_02210 [Puniceicoccaceae bacterium]